MLNLLLPDWFNPWGWTVLAVVLAVILVLVIVLVLRNVKKSKADEADEEDDYDESEYEEYVDEDEKEPAKKQEGRSSSATKVYHISKRKSDGKWQVKAAGAEKALKLFKTQAEAIDYAKTVAGNQEAKIMIHKVDGSFRPLTYK